MNLLEERVKVLKGLRDKFAGRDVLYLYAARTVTVAEFVVGASELAGLPEVNFSNLITTFALFRVFRVRKQSRWQVSLQRASLDLRAVSLCLWELEYESEL